VLAAAASSLHFSWGLGEGLQRLRVWSDVSVLAPGGVRFVQKQVNRRICTSPRHESYSFSSVDLLHDEFEAGEQISALARLTGPTATRAARTTTIPRIVFEVGGA